VLTLWRGKHHFTVPCCCIGFVFTFVNGGLSGCIWVTCGRRATVAHAGSRRALHMVMACAGAGLVRRDLPLVPEITGRMMDTRWQIHFWVTFVRLLLHLLSDALPGLPGVPRRYYALDSMRLSLNRPRSERLHQHFGADRRAVQLCSSTTDWSYYKGNRPECNPGAPPRWNGRPPNAAAPWQLRRDLPVCTAGPTTTGARAKEDFLPQESAPAGQAAAATGDA